MSASDLSRPVFIVGCPRSGNTLLGCILNKHPEFLIFFEQNLFSALYRRWDSRVRGGADRQETFLQLTERYCSDVIEAAGIDLPDYRSQIRRTDGTWQTLLNEFACFAMEAGKPSACRFGDKTPHHIARTAIIARHYPYAQFLFVYRDPRDTVFSMTKESFPYTSNDPVLNAHVVGNYYETFRTPIEEGTPKNVFDVRYEDLVRDPETVTREICDFLEVEYTASMLEAKEGPIQALVGAGWVDYKGWGEVRPQPSSKANPLKDDPVMNWMLDEWIQSLGYDRSTSRPGLPERLRARFQTLPMRLQEMVFSIPWRWKYPKHSPFLLEKPVTKRQIKSWLTGGE